MQRPFRQLELRHAPIEILSADEVAMIHTTGLTILEEIGMKVLSERARTLCAQGGADLESGMDRVRFGRAMSPVTLAGSLAQQRDGGQ